jgi:hypothetical protein
MTNPTVATEIHESLDIHSHFTTEVALDREAGDSIAQSCYLRFTEVFDFRARLYAGLGADTVRTRSTNAVYRRQRDADVLVDWNIDSCNTCHCFTLDAACGAGRCKSLARHDCAE